MNRISPTVAAVIAGIFALLLVLYVFAGGKGRGENPDRLSDDQITGAAKQGSAVECSSQQTFDLLKAELFRQAADVRGADGGTFSNVASYSFLRVMDAKTVSGQEAGAIACTGRVTLDLPPGLSVAGGRHSLVSDVNYAVRPGAGAADDTVTVTNADDIITPLATLSKAGTAAGEVTTSEGPSEVRDAPPAQAPQTQAMPKPPTARPAPPPVARVPVRPVPTTPREPAAPPPASVAPRATASPSFNCRSARTYGEVAVCNDGGLATLDRQMAGQFNRAVAAADRGKRLQLQRSRNRFLRFRDSCSSESCVAAAYRDRMREIDDIMNERWSPR
jgi:hypothetical protein